MRQLRYACAAGALLASTGLAGCGDTAAAPDDLPDALRTWTWEEATECDGGCTYTQGYWKNHSKYAKNESQQIPWPYMSRDPLGEDNEFCGVTWYELLQMPPKGGDAYLILAHQWIAARLNVADEGPNACHPPLVTWALTRGEELLEGCVISDEDRAQALRLAGWLGDFNEGTIGPGHCDDECDEGEVWDTDLDECDAGTAD